MALERTWADDIVALRKAEAERDIAVARVEELETARSFDKLTITTGAMAQDTLRAERDALAAEVERMQRLEKVAECAKTVCSVCGRHGCGTDYRNCWYVSEAGLLSRCAVGAALAELDAGEGTCLK